MKAVYSFGRNWHQEMLDELLSCNGSVEEELEVLLNMLKDHNIIFGSDSECQQTNARNLLKQEINLRKEKLQITRVLREDKSNFEMINYHPEINAAAVSKKKKGSKRNNYNVLYKKYVEANIRCHDKLKRLPNQKEIAKQTGYSRSTISRLLNDKRHLKSIIILVIDVQKGKEILGNYSHLNAEQNETLSKLNEYFSKYKTTLISNRG